MSILDIIIASTPVVQSGKVVWFFLKWRSHTQRCAALAAGRPWLYRYQFPSYLYEHRNQYKTPNQVQPQSHWDIIGTNMHIGMSEPTQHEQPS